MSAFAVHYERDPQQVVAPLHVKAFTGALYDDPRAASACEALGATAVGIKSARGDPDQPVLAKQPDAQGDDWIVLAGRIDNADILRKTVSTRTWRQQDERDIAYIILNGYKCYGEQWLKKIYGSFICVIYIQSQHRLILCRDPIGDQALYYLLTPNGSVVVSTDETAIIKACISTPYDKSYLLDTDKQWIAATFHHHRRAVSGSYFKQIKQVPPGHCFKIDPHSQRLIRFWCFPNTRISDTNFRTIEHEFKEKLSNAVSRVTQPFNLVPTLLSGGMDSTSITALAAQQNVNLIAVSHVFDRYSDCDEREYLTLMNNTLNIRTIQVNADECLPLSGDITQLHRTLSHIWVPPMINQRRLSYPVLQQLGARCFLTGEFGDHLFTDYRYWLRDLWASQQAIVLKARGLKQLWNRSAGALYQDPVFKRMLPFYDRLAMHRRVYPVWLTEDARRALKQVHPGDAVYHTPQHRRDRFYNYFHQDTLALGSMVQQEARYYGLKALMPFRDRELIEYTLNVPAYFSYDFQSGQHKYLLRQSMKGVLPEAIRHRKQATVYNTIFRESLTRTHAALVRDILFDSSRQWPEFVEEEYIQKVITVAPVSDGDLMLLWSCICFELWSHRLKQLSAIKA